MTVIQFDNICKSQIIDVLALPPFPRYLLQKEEHEDSELDEIAQSLQKSEFYDLPPRHKIHVLYVLVDEIIRTRTFNAAIDDHIERTTKARYVGATFNCVIGELVGHFDLLLVWKSDPFLFLEYF